MKGLILHLAILAALASAALIVVGFETGGRMASADDFVLGTCPTPTPGTPTATNTPGGPTKTASPTSTPCQNKIVPTFTRTPTITPPPAVGGLAAGPGLSPLAPDTSSAGAPWLVAAAIALAFALAGSSWYAHRRWVTR